MNKFFEILGIKVTRYYQRRVAFLHHKLTMRWQMIWCVHDWLEIPCTNANALEKGLRAFTCVSCGALKFDKPTGQDLSFTDE